MVIEKARPISDAIFFQLVKPFLFVDANLVTLLAFLWSVLAVYFYFKDLLIWAALCVIMNGVFDVVDGKIAKSKKTAKPFGIFLDPAFDRLSDMMVIVGIAVSPYCGLELGFVLVIVTFLVSYFGTLGLQMKVGRVSGGLVSRGDRIMIMITATIVQHFLRNPFYGRFLLEWIVIILIATSAISVIQRLLTITNRLKHES